MAENNNICGSCIHEQEIAELKKDAERNSTQHREFYNRFFENEKSMAISEERYNNLLALISEVKTALNELKDKPAKKWDSISTYITTTIIGAVLGFLLKVILGG